MRRLELLQWFGLLAAPLAWTVQLVVGFGVADASCARAGSHWGIDVESWEIAITPAAANSPGVVHTKTGAGLYAANCAKCHGPHGEGYKAPKLEGVGARAADFYLRTGAMPLARVGEQPNRSRVLFSEFELRALIKYVAGLGGGPPVPKPHPERGSVSRGFRLFTDHCAGCHQVAAEGGFVTGARVPPLEDATPTQIAEAVRI